MAERQSQLKETKKREHIFRDFGGINTQAFRTSIKDVEFSWLENAMPIGHGNIKCVPAPTSVLATISPDVANNMQSANIGGVNYVFLFCNSGAAYQISSVAYAVTKFANAGTFSASGTAIAQWQNSRILIIDPINGLYTWDGATLTHINNQVQSVSMTAYGAGYFHVPTVVFTPTSGGSGASATAVVGIGTYLIAGGGTGYVIGDVLTLVGGTSTTKAQLTVTSVSATNVITGVSLTNQGNYSIAPTSPVSVTGGFGVGATFTIQWSVVLVNMLLGGSGYLSAPTISFTATGGDTPTVVATALANVSTAPSAGTDIAVYSGRVWIGNGRTIYYSAPASYNDFSVGNAGGSFNISDGTLNNSVNQLCSANNYLYIFGDDSINVISNVAVSSGITTFSNTNLTAFVGSSIPLTVQPYLRGVFFGNQAGFYLVYGAVPQKVSDPLDGIFQFIDFTQPVTGGSVMIFNQLCMCFMFTYTGGTSPRKLMAIYFNNKWFLASQGNNLTLCCPVFEDGRQELYITDGTQLFHAFKSSTNTINSTIQTRLWDFGSSLVTKQALKAGLEIDVPNTIFSANLSVDTENASNLFALGSQNAINWVNNSNVTLLWTNNALQTVVWLSTGFTYIMSDVTNYGKYIGFTMTSTVPNYQLNAMMLEFEDRARW